MQLGYHAGGLSQHNLMTGLGLLADIGYQSVAIGVDFGWLCPTDPQVDQEVQRARSLLNEKEMACVVEATANYLLDPRRRNWPTLMENDPGHVEARMRYLKYCVDVSSELGAVCMSLRSGPKPVDVSFDVAMSRFVDGLFELLKYASSRNVHLSVEPEPGMLIDTLGRYERLLHLVDSPSLGLTLDVGHAFCSGEVPLDAQVEKWFDKLVNVHIDDAISGVHQHLPPGEGQINFGLVIDSLAKHGYSGPIHVDLEAHSHVGAEMAVRCHEFFNPMIVSAIRGEFS